FIPRLLPCSAGRSWSGPSLRAPGERWSTALPEPDLVEPGCCLTFLTGVRSLLVRAVSETTATYLVAFLPLRSLTVNLTLPCLLRVLVPTSVSPEPVLR